LSKSILARTWIVIAVMAAIGLLVGVFGAHEYTARAERFMAEATIVMLPAPQLPDDVEAGYWEVLSRGQVTRSAAIVIGDSRWLDAAAARAGVPKSELALSAGAIPDTTLIDVTMQANSARAAELALEAVLGEGIGYAAKILGPFKLETISSVSGKPQSMVAQPRQMIGAFGLAGLLVGVGAALLIIRAAQRRSTQRRSTQRRSTRIEANQSGTAITEDWPEATADTIGELPSVQMSQR
jgi:hypothetical protein